MLLQAWCSNQIEVYLKFFKELEHDPEDSLSNLKFKLPMKKIINMKMKMKIKRTVEQYRMLKKFLSEYLTWMRRYLDNFSPLKIFYLAP